MKTLDKILFLRLYTSFEIPNIISSQVKLLSRRDFCFIYTVSPLYDLLNTPKYITLLYSTIL